VIEVAAGDTTVGSTPIGRDGDLDLSCQGSDIYGIQIEWSAWEPSILAEEQQPRCKGEAVLSAFGHHHAEIAGGQRLWGCFIPALIDHDAITSVFAALAKQRISAPTLLNLLQNESRNL